MKPSTAMVAQRPRARRDATLPAAKSICAISQPPKMSPAGLVSDGMAMVRIAGSPWGRSISFPSHNEAHLRRRGAGIHVAAAIEVVLDLGRRARHPRHQENGECGG